MNAERAREFLLGLPHVVETSQFGGIVFWVGDKALGGKMFVMMNLEGGDEPPIWWPVGAERFGEMREVEGLRPAPYLARIWWVAAERWGVLRDAEWEEQLRASHRLVLEKLPRRVRASLELPKAQLQKLVAERRKLLAAKSAAKKG